MITETVISQDGVQLGHPDTQEAEASVVPSGALGIRKGCSEMQGRHSTAKKAEAVTCLRGVSGVILLDSLEIIFQGPEGHSWTHRLLPSAYSHYRFTFSRLRI